MLVSSGSTANGANQLLESYPFGTKDHQRMPSPSEEPRATVEVRERLGDAEGPTAFQSGAKRWTLAALAGRGGREAPARAADTTTVASGKPSVLPWHRGDGDAGVVGGAAGIDVDTEEPRKDEGSCHNREDWPAALLEVSHERSPRSSSEDWRSLQSGTESPNSPGSSPRSTSSSRYAKRGTSRQSAKVATSRRCKTRSVTLRPWPTVYLPGLSLTKCFASSGKRNRSWRCTSSWSMSSSNSQWSVHDTLLLLSTIVRAAGLKVMTRSGESRGSNAGEAVGSNGTALLSTTPQGHGAFSFMTLVAQLMMLSKPPLFSRFS